jgi:hypothetical protein
VLILLSLCLFGFTDEKTSFSEAELAKGAAIWQKCRVALGADTLANVAHVTFRLKVTGRSGGSWIDEYQVDLEKPLYTINTQGKSFTRKMGFDGYLGWEVPRNVDAPPIKPAPKGTLASNAEEIRRWYHTFAVLLVQSYPAAFLGEEDIDGTSYTIIRLLHPDDNSLFLDLWVSQADYRILQGRFWTRIRRDGTQRSYIMHFSNYKDFAGLQYPSIWKSKVTKELLSLEPLNEAPDYSRPETAHYRKPRRN